MQKCTLYISLLAALALYSIPCPAQAHPHVFVDASLVFEFDDTSLKNIHEQWLFDDMFTQAILGDLELTPETLNTTLGQEKIRQGAFQFLKNYDYFTIIESAGQRIPVPDPIHFKASLKDNRLAYDFTVPLELPYGQIRDFRLGVFDREYYSDIVLMNGGIAFEIGGMVQVSHAIRPAKDHTYWQFIVPNMIHLSVSGAPTSAPTPREMELEPAETPGPIEYIMNLVRSTQRQLTEQLNTFGMELRDSPYGSALWLFLGLSFVYGIVHAVGPGHGKAVVCSYFLANPGSLVAGAIMGNAITFVHMGSAGLAVGAAYLIFSTGMGGFAEASRTIQPASYVLLSLMGVYLFIKSILDLRKGGLLSGEACGHDHAEPDDLKSILAVSFVTGLVPCPGAAVILAFAIGVNIFWTGVAALIAMAIGMGITTTLFAWFAVTARSVTLQLSARNLKLCNWIYAGLSICGAAAIALFGAALFYGNISG